MTPEQGRRRGGLFRWKGIVPLLLFLVLLGIVWITFGEPIVADTVEEAASKALGTQVDVGELEIDEIAATITLRSIAIADPFDSTRNLVEAGQLRVVVDPEPLLEKKVIIERLALSDVRTGTRRSTPARSVGGDGFVPRAAREIRRFREQFEVPLLSLTPIDTIRSIILDPSQLSTVRSAQSLLRQTDSARAAIAATYQGLRIEQTLDTARALVARLQTTNARALGVSGVRAAVADVQNVAKQIDSTRSRIERLATDARASLSLVETGVRSLDSTRRADYAFARGLLRLPTFDAPDIGAALFGDVTIERFQQALYWAMIAREHAPPGLLPRRTAGPSRLRRAGTTVHFVERTELPRLLIRRADIGLTVTGGAARGTYALGLANVTTEPAVLGRPMLFALVRQDSGGSVGSVSARGTVDHTTERPRDVLNVDASGLPLPRFAIPMLPLRADPGRGTSQLRVTLDGDRVSGQWTVRSSGISWTTDSARTRPLNSLETVVARVISGLGDLDLTADVGGELSSPTLRVRSNLDRAIAARIQAVAGEQIERAESRVRAQVDRIVEEHTAPVRARIIELRSEADATVAAARTRLEEERAKLDAQLRSITGGLVRLPGIGG